MRTEYEIGKNGAQLHCDEINDCTPFQNHKLIHSKVNMHQQRFSTSMQKTGQSFLDVTAWST